LSVYVVFGLRKKLLREDAAQAPLLNRSLGAKDTLVIAVS
jgi:hypothetical protein